MIKSNSDRELALSISSFLTPPAAKNSSVPPSSKPSKFSPHNSGKAQLCSQHRPIDPSGNNNSRNYGNIETVAGKRRSKKRGRSRKIYGNNNNVVSISIDDSDDCVECGHIYYRHSGDPDIVSAKASEDSVGDEHSDQIAKASNTASDYTVSDVGEGERNAENISPHQFIADSSTTTKNLTSIRQRNSAKKLAARNTSFAADNKMVTVRGLRRAKSSEEDREDPYLLNGGSCVNLPPHRYSVVEEGTGFKDSSTDTSFAFRNSKYSKVNAPAKQASPIHQHQQTDDTECCSTSQIVTINVSGLRFQTFDSTLSRYPNSLLGNPMKRRRYWNEECQEYFLDRHRTTFEAILHVYQTCGQVIRPESVPISLFLKELSFYELGDEVLENFWASEGYQKPTGDILPKNRWQRKMWQLMEFPDSSILARILAFVSVSVIIISIVSFCLETLPELKRENEVNNREWSSPFFWIEFSCCLWFSVELFVRFVSSPSKSQFMKSFLNVLDFVAVAPFFTNLLWYFSFKI